ncbi:phosphotransferase family protein [Actinocorallia sp. A-T 12471]|uniref:phosphotransferase family protein n=1 Tax=Actinocorallia sp. A-T 12471 TaxID=3089813 RepID=UPI0029CC4ED8|nr:phosphotransferase family protein [Actinocorallia sp. A-T 12471]MDX6740113.1 phosphotransferase family protein [Actinocorallia sp. A-T 12471]
MTMTAPPGVDVPALDAFLREAAPGLLTGPLRVELLSGGRSNLTYLLTDGTGRWVLRRPPLGHVLETAHDMGREYRVLSALHLTDVPVPAPRVIGGRDVIGAPFYVMDFADGLILRDLPQVAAFAGPPATGLAASLMRTLATLHSLDPDAVGLGGLGRPEGYLARQVARWQRQAAASHSRDIPGFDALATRLAARLPTPQPATIVHGDYRLDNVVISPDADVVAVLDWEMATLGDPLTDLASAIVWWDGLTGLDSPVATVPGDVPGFPTSEALLTTYTQATGADLTDLPWYLAFAYYKLAAIFESIHFRAQANLTIGPGFTRLAPLVPALITRAHTTLTPTPNPLTSPRPAPKTTTQAGSRRASRMGTC